MENKLKDICLELKEIKSCMLILQKALENENDEILKTDIDNYLEILLEKIDKAIACYERITNLIIQNQEWTKNLMVQFFAPLSKNKVLPNWKTRIFTLKSYLYKVMPNDWNSTRQKEYYETWERIIFWPSDKEYKKRKKLYFDRLNNF